MTIDEMKKSSPKGKFMATVKVGSKGQIVIPKEVRDMFSIAPGDTVVLLADEKRGIAIQEYSVLSQILANGFDKKKKGGKKWMIQ